MYAKSWRAVCVYSTKRAVRDMPWSPEDRVAQCSTITAGHKTILTALELGEPARIFESTVPALATRARVGARDVVCVV